jgi:deazaflavin-dependent oxidoreductase (nitroreductase family)
VDDIAIQLAGWGTVLRLETRGRTSGRPAEVAVGYVEEPDGTYLVAAGSDDAAWARNLLASPDCRVTVGDAAFEAAAELLEGADFQRASRELILRYGPTAERLGHGPAFRLTRKSPG